MTKQNKTHYSDEMAPGAQPSEDTPKRELKQRPILPQRSVAGTALIAVIGIMAFLTSMTLGAVILVQATAQSWQSDISREVTIQLQPREDVDQSQAFVRLQEAMEAVDGVQSITMVDDEAMGLLLAPWLGDGFDLTQLPVPRLFTVQIDESSPPDLGDLKTRVENAVPGASLDDHRAWVERLTTMARATILIGLVVLTLILSATVLCVVFATRGAMSGNRDVIEVLHFVGADKSYIASQFQFHFLMLGLKGAIGGGLIAILAFLLIGAWTASSIADPTNDQVTALFGSFSLGYSGYLGVILLVGLLAFLAAATSRLTVLRHVGALDGVTEAAK